MELTALILVAIAAVAGGFTLALRTGLRRRPAGARAGEAAPAGGDHGRRLLLWFVLGSASALALCIGGIEALARFAPEHLPPPAISNRISLDEKLLFLRNNPQLRPRILGIGSSITMRSLDGSAFQRPASQPAVFLNTGLGGGQIHQIRFVSEFYLELYPEVGTLVQMVVPPDFADCTRSEATLFDRRDGRDFVLGRMSLARAYLKYFNPHELIPQAMHIALDRRTWTEGASGNRLYMDPYGSMPMQTTAATALRRHRELYGSTSQLDPRCFEELTQWARHVAAQGRRLYIVVPPVSPIFLRDVPDAPAHIEEFVDRLRDAVGAEEAVVIDARDDIALGEADFADAYHLQWSAARLLSRRIAAVVEATTLVAPRPVGDASAQTPEPG